MKSRFCFLGLMMCISVGTVASAEESIPIEEYKYEVEKESDISAEEVKEILTKTLEAEGDAEEGVVILGEETDEAAIDKYDVAKMDYAGMYVEYFLEDLLITSYFETESFENVITDNYIVKVPYTTKYGKEAIFLLVEGDGELKPSEQRFFYKEEFRNSSAIEEAVKKAAPGAVIEDVKYTTSSQCYMSLVYVKTNVGEYVIPYMYMDYIELESKKAYTVADFFDKLNRMFDESQIDGNLNGGGLSYRENNYLVFSVMLGIGIMVFGGIIVFWRKKRRFEQL